MPVICFVGQITPSGCLALASVWRSHRMYISASGLLNLELWRLSHGKVGLVRHAAFCLPAVSPCWWFADYFQRQTALRAWHGQVHRTVRFHTVPECQTSEHEEQHSFRRKRLLAAGIYLFGASGAAIVAQTPVYVSAEETAKESSGQTILSQASFDKAGPFHYHVNRGKRNFDAAFSSLMLENSDYTTDEQIIFTYFDTYGGKQAPEFDESIRVIKLIPRSVTNSFDNKRILAQRLQEAGHEAAFAPTYMSAEQAVLATQGSLDALFFVKSPWSTAGKGMRVVRRSELLENGSLAGNHEILQLAVQDLMLIDGCKFVIRFYLLVHDGKVVLHRRAIVTVHGFKYDRDSTDYDVQISHNSQKAASRVRVFPMDTQVEQDQWYRSIKQRAQELMPGLQALLDASSRNNYAIIGVDAVIASDGNARLLELNMYPNLWDLNETTNKEVKQPFLRDVLLEVLLNVTSAEFEYIGMLAS